MNVVFFLQPGDGIVFMAQTLEKLCQEKLTLMPKPECEAKGRKMSEDIEQHVLGQMPSSSLKCRLEHLDFHCLGENVLFF